MIVFSQTDVVAVPQHGYTRRMPKLILASASPRRRQLIQLFGLPIEVMVADVDESSVTVPDSAENARLTALIKAEAIAATLNEDAIIISSDTNVAIDGDILGKPRDSAEARAMLRRLTRTHPSGSHRYRPDSHADWHNHHRCCQRRCADAYVQ